MPTAETETKPLPFTPVPLSPVLGAEVEGFDVRTLTDPDAVAATMDYLRACQVLVFRDQALTEHDLVAFIRRFGEPQYHVLNQFLMKSAPEIYLLSNIKENGEAVGNAYEGIGWHTDYKGQKQNTAYTVLYGLEVPPEGGETCFASMYKAYEALPDARKRQLEGLKYIYNYGRQYETRLKELDAMGVTDHLYGRPLTPEQQEYAKQRHPVPLVDANPVSGRRWLHMATTGCAGVEGMSDADGIAFVEELVEWATSAPFRYDHKWRVRDLVMWDNRGLFHVAGEYDRTRHRRLIWRCSIAE